MNDDAAAIKTQVDFEQAIARADIIRLQNDGHFFVPSGTSPSIEIYDNVKPVVETLGDSQPIISVWGQSKPTIITRDESHATIHVSTATSPKIERYDNSQQTIISFVDRELTIEPQKPRVVPIEERPKAGYAPVQKTSGMTK